MMLARVVPMMFAFIVGCSQLAIAIGDDTIRFVDVTEQAGLRKPLAGIMGRGGGGF